MKKSIATLLTIFILLTTVSIQAQLPIQNTIQTQNPPTIQPTNLQDDILDQSKIDCDDVLPFGAISYETPSNQSLAQSFIPQTQVLTRIKILLAKNITTIFPCILTLAKNLTDNPLIITHVPATNITIYDNLSWIEFEFDDIEIINNTQYFFILSTENITDNFYYCGTNTSDNYANGSAFIRYSDTQDWVDLVVVDLCFEIYGKYLPDLEIGFVGGFGLTVCFTNYGLGDAHNLRYDVIIKGGIQGLIDVEDHGAFGTIAAGGEECVTLPVFGLGWVNITAKLDDLIVQHPAIVILIFIF
jgi:hypothetical protein